MIQIRKICTFFNKHKVFFGILFLLPLYHFLVAGDGVPFQVKEVNYTFHAVDFSMGFCSRLLPGSIYKALVGVYTRTAVSVYLLFVYFLFVILLAALIEQFARRFKNHPKACITFIIFFLTGPVTFNLFVVELGMLDFYWLIFFLLGCLCLLNKYIRFFVPVIVALMILTYYASIFNYVVVMLFIILLFWMKASEKKERRIYLIIFGISFVLAVSMTLYFLKNDTSNLVYDVKDFSNIMRNERDAHPAYYSFAFYKYYGSEYANSRLYDTYKLGLVGEKALTNNIFESILARVKAALYYAPVPQLIASIVAGLISQVFLIHILTGYIKKEKKVIKQLITVAFIAAAFVMEIIGVFFSNDTPRWVGHSVILMFAFVMYLLCLDYEEGIEKIDSLFHKIRYPLVWVFLFFYSGMIMDPYIMKF